MTTNLNTIALAKASEKLMKKASKLKPGTHNVSMTAIVRINGTITKLKDTEKTPTVSIPMKTTLALVLHRAGFQREQIACLLTEAMTEALNMGEHAGERITSTMLDIDEAMERVYAITEALPKTPVAGATNCNLTIEVEEVTAVPVG